MLCILELKKMDRKCRECDRVVFGRVDKIFCSDECRNAYNNARERERKHETIEIDRILKRNLRILKELTAGGYKRVAQETLSSMGFDFRYVTSVKFSKGGKILMQCYNYSYVNSSKGVVYISEKNN